jgi:predicted DsbA family dithiol-disulfide isomerase
VRAAETQAAVAADAAEVAALEIPGTPTFVVRRRLVHGGFVEARVEGYESWDHFNTLLTDMLQREEP